MGKRGSKRILGLENLLELTLNPEAANRRNDETLHPDFLESDTSGNNTTTPGGPTTVSSTQQQNEQSHENANENEEESEDPFPHDDYSRIDFRTLEPGDGTTYPSPYSYVKYKYLGYIHHRETGRWEQFTPTKIAEYEHHTQLSVGGQVPGLEEALLTMSEGEKAKVWVPSRLGYGIHGAGGLVPPNCDLVFIVTLLSVVSSDDNYPNVQVMSDAENPNPDPREEDGTFTLTFNAKKKKKALLFCCVVVLFDVPGLEQMLGLQDANEAENDNDNQMFEDL
ncbi:peptidylprolyl isomerase FKBP-type [Reticulomyxa filosa]|uniref:peptidylprolyl isomerase n=1 Tax=Reticulomyxa filosa TaxID=46433 RepID=X6NN75_RETFI|nr:peptidylprolyl isomerase FKBP-type [Reticulomyxa filosa]|eukprot:ETO26847.1 peptidylprolyl isomerase FKBP-type [Reticulomyxa filosa]